MVTANKGTILREVKGETLESKVDNSRDCRNCRLVAPALSSLGDNMTLAALLRIQHALLEE